MLTPKLRRRWALAYAAYIGSSNVNLTGAVWVVYLAGRGYSPLAIGLFEMLFHVAKFLAEAPTGVFADLVGRRASLILSCALNAAATLLLLSPAAQLIALSFALSGVSWAFKGGAQEAVIWTLAERSGGAGELAYRYSRLFSRMLVLMLIASALGEASGGFLFRINFAVPFTLSALTTALAIVPLLLIPETRAQQDAHDRRDELRALWRPLAHLSDGLSAVWRNPTLLALLLFSGLEAAIFTTTGFYTQLYFHQLGFTLGAIGVIVAIGSVVDFLATALAPRLIARIRRRWLLAALYGAVALGVLIMSLGNPVVGLVGFLLLIHPGDAIFVPAMSASLNERAPEAQRATVLSLDTTLFSAAMIVAFPLFGLGLTRIPFGVAYLCAFGALIVGGGVILLIQRARRRQIYHKDVGGCTG